MCVCVYVCVLCVCCVVCVVCCVCVVCVCCVCAVCVCCVYLLCYGIYVATFTIGWRAMCGIHVKQDVPRSDRRARPTARAF